MSNPQPINQVRIQIGDLTTPQGVAAVTKHLQTLYNSSILVTTGSGAPILPPTKISAQYIDLINKNVYVATGNTKTSDWVKVS